MFWTEIDHNEYNVFSLITKVYPGSLPNPHYYCQTDVNCYHFFFNPKVLDGSNPKLLFINK